ncbi:MAG: hypothetical protein L3J74_11625 [Bacteroidales bacterium]|nr:hypothetical protein [Bacteroidales bacterium]
MSNDKLILIIAASLVAGHILLGIIWLIVKIMKAGKKKNEKKNNIEN